MASVATSVDDVVATALVATRATFSVDCTLVEASSNVGYLIWYLISICRVSYICIYASLWRLLGSAARLVLWNQDCSRKMPDTPPPYRSGRWELV